jgi:hypothetical protein
MSADEFRRLALSFPEAAESAPLGVAEFRVRTKVFATLGYPEGERGTLKLTPEEQAEYVAADPQVFPAKGSRGQRGWTVVHLAAASTEMLRAALVAAWRSAAPRQLVRQYEIDGRGLPT